MLTKYNSPLKGSAEWSRTMRQPAYIEMFLKLLYISITFYEDALSYHRRIALVCCNVIIVEVLWSGLHSVLNLEKTELGNIPSVLFCFYLRGGWGGNGDMRIWQCFWLEFKVSILRHINFITRAIFKMTSYPSANNQIGSVVYRHEIILNRLTRLIYAFKIFGYFFHIAIYRRYW